MGKSYKVVKKTMNMGEKKGQTVYTVRPVSYGTLTTSEVARQISMESTATPADVMAVLERYAYYVKENLKKGYDIELLGFGKLFIRFINDKAVTDASLATAKMVKGLIPAFRPAFTLLQNGTRVYSLLSDKIEIVKYDENEKKKKNSGTTDGGDQPSGGGSGSTTEGGEATFD